MAWACSGCGSASGWSAGGSGYVRKSVVHTDLIAAIRAVHQGEVFLYPAGARLLMQAHLDKLRAGAPTASATFDGLSEREVLRLTAEGYSAQECGQRLNLSPKTVETYRQRVMEKLGLRHRSELVRYALRSGLLDGDTA